MQRKRALRITLLVLAALMAALPALQGCAVTSHDEQPATLGRPITMAALERILDEAQPAGGVELQTFNSADWVADLSVVLNLQDPAAQSAGLVERKERIQVYLHALRHPSRGLFLIDTGFSSQMARAPGSLGAGWVMRKAMQLDQLKFHLGPADVLKTLAAPVQGVFLTHMHPDHLGGLSEVPLDTPIYVGPGETKERHWTHFFTRPVADRALQGRPALQSWNFDGTTDESAQQLNVIDVFGDGSVFALGVPGHTRGSTAYLVRTTQGAVLLTGDASHTRWGWDHGVEPGTSSRDAARSRDGLMQLRALVARHPRTEVRVGHQR